jgi:hypothetical protein
MPPSAASTTPLTPELVLVCPELAEEARKALPDRPWEVFAPPVAAEPGTPPATSPAAVSPLAASDRPVIRLPRSRVPQQVAPATTRRTRRPPSRARLAAEAVVATAVFLGALTWASERTPVPRFGEGEPATAAAPGSMGTRAGGIRSVPAPAVLAFPMGMISVGPGARTAAVSFSKGCAAGGSTPALTPHGGALAYEGPLLGARVRTSLRVEFTAADRAQVVLSLRGPGCPRGEFELTASLS